MNLVDILEDSRGVNFDLPWDNLCSLDNVRLNKYISLMGNFRENEFIKLIIHTTKYVPFSEFKSFFFQAYENFFNFTKHISEN